MLEISPRSPLTAGVALTAASAIAFTPLIAADTTSRTAALTPVATPSMTLTAAVAPGDIAALANRLAASSDALSATVTSLAGLPGQTLVNALNSAVALNNKLWDSLIAATDNRTLVDVLRALKAASNGGLTRLASTLESANRTVVLTTGEITSLLSSTLTGSLGAAQHAVATILASPLSVSSYTALVNVPLDLAGLALTSGLASVGTLGGHALTLGRTLVTGVTAQISTALRAVNDLIGAAQGLSDIALVDGVLTAVQGIVSAPVTVTVAGVNGLTGALASAASTALTRLTNGAAGAVAEWIGNGTSPGALQTAVSTIGAAPLSPAAYTNAVSALVGAGIATVNAVVDTASSMASIPVSTAARLTTTAADMITSFNSALATTAAGIMQAAGLPSLVHNLPHVMAAAINGAVNVAALTTSAALNTIAAAIDLGNMLSGAMPARQTLTLRAAPSPELTAPATESEPVAGSETEAEAAPGEPAPGIEADTGKPPTAAVSQDVALRPAAEATPIDAEALAPVEDATAIAEAAKPVVTEDITEVKEDLGAAADSAESALPVTSPRPQVNAAATDDGLSERRATDSGRDVAGESSPASDKQSGSKRPTTVSSDKDADGPDTDRRGTAAGGRHVPGKVRGATSVTEIKKRLDNEAADKAGSSTASAGHSGEAG